MIKTFAGKAAFLAATALTLAIGPAAHAQEAGKIQVKLLGTAVLPDGKITEVKKDLVGIGSTNTDANDNYVPTLAIEYFFTPNISIETICCLTEHDVDATSGPLAPGELVADAKILPATLTVKYHLPTGAGLKPYVGAGPTYFIFIDEKPGATVKAALPRQKMDDTFGFVLQAGVDVPLGTKGFGLSLDAKRYFLRPDAHWYLPNGTEAIVTHHKLDPWVLSAGVAYRF